ncbi:MAG: hypothetical protein K2X34_06340, partial [Hyphomonadaceae bacterium]|nr:hypothetical protein [Hyphomonadaceae bacterium]
MRNALPFVVLTLALVALPVLAHAQKDEETAAPGSIAIGMIEAANAEGVFEIVHNGQVSVRHIGSGLRCDFERSGDGGRLIVYPNATRGDDVACDFETGNHDVTLYATRYPGPPTLDLPFADAVAAIEQVYPGARALEPSYDVNTEGMPPHRAARFLLVKDGITYFSSVHIAQLGDWTIKQRYSVPVETAEQAVEADRAASLHFEATLA